MKILLSSYLIISLLTCFANWNIRRGGLEGIPYKQCFNPLKWLNVLIGFTLKSLIPLHVLEQFVLRFYDDDCSTCLIAGNCTTCGCDTKAKMWSPGESDSRDNWGPIIWNKQKYLEYRKATPVKIVISYG